MLIENIPINDIKPYERNAKKHPVEQVENIANSIKAFGFKQPLVVDKDNVLVIGHGRLLAAKVLGLDTVPCVRADDLTPEQIKALRLADNKTNESAWDFDLLDTELAELDGLFDMTDFGFEEVITPDAFDDAFSLPDGDKPEVGVMSFSLHREQIELIKCALPLVADEITETFGNTNKNGNAIYEIVRQWAEQRK